MAETNGTGAEVTPAAGDDIAAGSVTLDMIAAAHDRLMTDDTEERLRQERNELIQRALREGMTKAEIHRRIGVSEAHIGRIEQGRTTGRHRPPE